MQIKNFANIKHNMEKSHQFEKTKHFSLISQIHTEKFSFLKCPIKPKLSWFEDFMYKRTASSKQVWCGSQNVTELLENCRYCPIFSKNEDTF